MKPYKRIFKCKNCRSGCELIFTEKFIEDVKINPSYCPFTGDDKPFKEE